MKIIALTVFYLSLLAQDTELAALRATLLPLRSQPANDHYETRGATPELTTAKHQLRDWIESRLMRLPQDGDIAALSGTIHDALRASQLFCEDYSTQCHPSALGFVDEVLIDRSREFLIVRTALGIRCGYDESAYVYGWRQGRWQRIWEHEENSYTEENYLPQLVHDVHISSPDGEGNRLLLTLGSRSGCAGAFRPIYYRVWQMSPGLDTRLLLDRSELANDGYPPVKGRVLPGEALIEFTAGGTGYGLPHKALRRFEVQQGQAAQVDPIAPTPRDFVQEWLSAPWTRSVAWSDLPSLQEWHALLHREDGMGDFPDPTLRCGTNSDLWQVSTHVKDEPKRFYKVQWRPPFGFRLMGVSDQPAPECAVSDPKGDEQPVFISDFPD